MSDHLWDTQQQTNTLQNFRGDIHGVWSDNNSREINTRYLEPHHSDTVNMLQSFQAQEDALEQVDLKIYEANVARGKAHEAETSIQIHIKSIEGEMNNATHEYEFFAQYNNLARQQIPQIEALIDKANKAGGE